MISLNARNRQWTVTAALSLAVAVICLLHREALAAECPFGYQVNSPPNSSNVSACTPFNCTANGHPMSICEFLFPSSTCNPDSSRCECNSGFKLDRQQLQCIQNVTTTNSTSCSEDSDCSRKFGNNVYCKDNQCTCNLGYKWNNISEQCAKDTNKYTLNFQKCLSFATCGENAFCDSNSNGEGFCRCNFRYTATSNRKDCAQLECNSNYECSASFPNSVCQNFQCKCKPGYRLDTFFQKCKEVNWKKECMRTDDCGPNAICYGEICKCKMGFSWDEDQQRCNSQVCHSNSDCSNFAQTRCDQGIEQCVCNYGLEVNPSDQECRRPVETTSTTSASVGGECTSDEQCNHSFICNNNQCRCPVGMYHDVAENICRYFNEWPDHPSHTSHSSSNVGLIIGSTVGGIIALAIIVTVLWCVCRSGKRTPGRVVHPRPPVQVRNVQVPPVNNNMAATGPNAVQPSAPAVTPPTARNAFHQPQQHFHVPAQPSYNPYYNAPPPSYVEVTSTPINSNDGIRVYPTLPKQ